MKTLLFVLLMAGCADPYGDAEKAGTIEAWTTFLASNPSGTERLKGETQLEILMQKAAEASGKPEDYEAFIKRFPKSKSLKRMQEARAKAAWSAAEAANSPAGWKQFLDENDYADPALKKKARAMVAVAEYRDSLPIGEVKIEEVNLAEDPKGPKNGWGFSAEVTNSGDKTIEYLILELTYLDAAGAKLKADSYPLVAPSFGRMPVAEAITKPLAPGGKRTWSYSAGEMPEGWAKTVKLTPTTIRFEGTPVKEGAPPE